MRAVSAGRITCQNNHKRSKWSSEAAKPLKKEGKGTYVIQTVSPNNSMVVSDVFSRHCTI